MRRRMLLRDRDWDKIYADIMDHLESFGRYYPMVRGMIMKSFSPSFAFTVQLMVPLSM